MTRRVRSASRGAEMGLESLLWLVLVCILPFGAWWLRGVSMHLAARTSKCTVKHIVAQHANRVDLASSTLPPANIIRLEDAFTAGVKRLLSDVC